MPIGNAPDSPANFELPLGRAGAPLGPILHSVLPMALYRPPISIAREDDRRPPGSEQGAPAEQQLYLREGRAIETAIMRLFERVVDVWATPGTPRRFPA